jgi:hypothetical protein
MSNHCSRAAHEKKTDEAEIRWRAHPWAGIVSLQTAPFFVPLRVADRLHQRARRQRLHLGPDRRPLSIPLYMNGISAIPIDASPVTMGISPEGLTIFMLAGTITTITARPASRRSSTTGSSTSTWLPGSWAPSRWAYSGPIRELTSPVASCRACAVPYAERPAGQDDELLEPAAICVWGSAYGHQLAWLRCVRSSFAYRDSLSCRISCIR